MRIFSDMINSKKVIKTFHSYEKAWHELSVNNVFLVLLTNFTWEFPLGGPIQRSRVNFTKTTFHTRSFRKNHENNWSKKFSLFQEFQERGERERERERENHHRYHLIIIPTIFVPHNFLEKTHSDWLLPSVGIVIRLHFKNRRYISYNKCYTSYLFFISAAYRPAWYIFS